jgi:hypothetical protein
MSKGTRIALITLASLLMLVAVFAAVGGSSVSAQPDRAGSHLVSGAKVNLDHYREAAAPAVPGDLQTDFTPRGHGCESENHEVPLD